MTIVYAAMICGLIAVLSSDQTVGVFGQKRQCEEHDRPAQAAAVRKKLAPQYLYRFKNLLVVVDADDHDEIFVAGNRVHLSHAVDRRERGTKARDASRFGFDEHDRGQHGEMLRVVVLRSIVAERRVAFFDRSLHAELSELRHVRQGRPLMKPERVRSAPTIPV